MNKKLVILGVAVAAAGFFLSRRGMVSGAPRISGTTSVGPGGGTTLLASASPLALGTDTPVTAAATSTASPTALLPPPSSYSAPVVDSRKTSGNIAPPIRSYSVEPMDYDIDWSTVGGA